MASRHQSTPSPDRHTPGQLQRRLGVLDSTAIGLGSMLGAGVFVVFAPAAALAGPLLAVAVALAGVIAYCNAVASAQLAAQYPSSGGTYVYGRKRLGEWPGFIAGWGFVTGKTASCAAMALTFGHYAAPEFATPLAVAAVVVLTGVNLLGITRTALLTRILLGVVLATLAFVAAAVDSGAASCIGRRRRRSRGGRLGCAPGGRTDVLCLRRLCPDRDAGRRGQGPHPHHSAGHPRGAGRGLRDLPRAGAAAAVASAGGAAGRLDGAAARRRHQLAAQRRRPVRPGRRGRRVPRRAAGTDHGGGPDRDGDGAGT